MEDLVTHVLKALKASMQEGELTTRNCTITIVGKHKTIKQQTFILSNMRYSYIDILIYDEFYLNIILNSVLMAYMISSCI